MVAVDKAVIAKMSFGKDHFEILVDPDLALEYRKGVLLGLERVLAVNGVFKDSKKGERASSTEMQKHFGTTDERKISEKIIREGEVQLTTDQRRKLVEEKRLQVADIISKQGADPRTHTPHPQQRILNAMDQARVHIDGFKPAQEQVKDVLEKIQSIIPIAFEKIEIAIKIPMESAGRAASVVRSLAQIKHEEWKADCWIAVIDIPAGMQADIYKKLNDITAGKVDVKILKTDKI